MSRSALEKAHADLKRKYDDLVKRMDNLDKRGKDIVSALDRAEKRKDKDEIRKLGQELKDIKFEKDTNSRELEKTKKELEYLKSRKEKIEMDREKAKDRRERSKVEIRTTQLGGEITAEPTWVTIQTHVGPSLIGIKVIPFVIHSDASLSELMLSDRQLKFMLGFAISVYRKVIRNLYKLWYTTIGKLPFLGRKPITGDIRSDVIYNRSSHRDDVFVCLSMMDLDNEFFQSAGGVAKLYNLGWSSFVVADDVNKRASFCMRQFRGLCSTVQYSFIYSSLGQSKVFEDLEDVRKASSPFFKMSTKASRLMGECLATAKLENYLVEESEILTEDMKEFVRVMKPNLIKKLGEELDKAVEIKSPSKIQNTFKRFKVPDISMSSVESIARRKIPNFKKSYMLSQKVITNSLPKLPGKLVDPVAALVALKSSMKDDVMVETRANLKDIVAKLRSPDVQSKIKTEKAIVVVLSSLFGAGAIALFLVNAIANGFWYGVIAVAILVGIVSLLAAPYGVTISPPEEIV